jgi:hypothetical protein
LLQKYCDDESLTVCCVLGCTQVTNREVLLWLKGWDEQVFGKQAKKCEQAHFRDYFFSVFVKSTEVISSRLLCLIQQPNRNLR